MGTRIVRGVVAAAHLALAVGWGCSSTGIVAPDEPTAPSSQKLLGSFEVHVDPRAANPFTITPITRFARVGQIAGGLGSSSQAISVLGEAALSGGATWNSATSTLSATIGVTNNSATNNWDEPYLVISSITPTGSGTVTVQAVNPGTLRSSGGSAIASGGAGSKYGLADIPRTGHNYALQKIAFYDPSVVPFSFVADVVADTVGTTTVVNDVDDDTWNIEPYAQAAGGDCSETAASSPQLTCTTPPSGSGCDVTCPTSGSTTCPTGGTTDNCCVATSSSSGASNTCPTTSGTTCSCDQTYTANSGTVSFDCQATTDCNVRVDGPKVANVGCGAGSNCTLVCTKTGTTTCNITACTSASCSVTIETDSGSAASVTGSIQACTGTSICTVNCANQADCSLSCGSTTATCTMTGCDTAKSCAMTCPSGQAVITCTSAVGKKICAPSGTTC
jgi:hypothetical protein